MKNTKPKGVKLRATIQNMDNGESQGCEILDSGPGYRILSIGESAPPVPIAEERRALELAAGIVRQHNLLSTATLEERLATLDRLLNWWNFVALPVLEGKPAPDWAQPLIEELSKVER